ncbi:sugar ABC transporter ATP-binding protein [Proteiniclasticum sp. QWL-01]|uniref:sugar ABC transporter ATP-binding protein n=1 Tax=Proteiniclasticum sp. QWL-01 TaxID=3036945 RepID=UPI00240EAF13|nr:sugar ABC transporter ATP-binding protein [Proteiniclasticum sp. QWL-01]WFF72521.1 sugar ABC transporter ATP-binding protein [Proteiniclasticum sp. QWL-01]
MSSQKELLRLEGVGKEFDGNRVLRDVNFTLHEGEILGLVGENGAGKSTLMKILFGMNVIHETGGFEGKVFIEGNQVKFKSPDQALAAGIGMVHQEFSLIPGFTATENIQLNMEKTKKNVVSSVAGKKFETLDRKRMENESQSAIDKLGVDISAKTYIAEMPVGHKQFIEIAREINRENVKLLVLDEPTAVLTESEAVYLQEAMRKLADMGIGIIFISHRLHEIITSCDKIVVLRDGIVVKETPVEGVSVRDIAEWMVGRGVDESARHVARRETDEDIIMEIKNLWVDMPGETVKNVNLNIRRGEILGIGGLAGQGKIGLPNGIMGLYPAGGDVLFKGKKLDFTDPKVPLLEGIAFVSEDRRGVGLLLDEAIDWNIGFNAMQVQDKFIRRLGPIRLRDDKALKETAQKYIEQLEIKCTGPSQHARSLSGGNQQKVCLAKAFATDPELLFVSEPTRGIDVGAKRLVLESLERYNAENGTTIVVVSSELEELRSVADRIAIITEGKVFGIVPADTPAADFGLLMSGLEVTGGES